MYGKKLESRIVTVPNAGQFLVEYIEDNNQDYARKPKLGFEADIQKRPIESEYSGSNTIGFMTNNRKRPVEKTDKLELWKQNVKEYIKQSLGLNGADNQYKQTKIGFGIETEKPQKYDIKITPINYIILPTKPQQL